MTKLPPAPLTVETNRPVGAQHDYAGHVYLVDANGRKIGVLWGKPEEKQAMADLILQAANG